MCTWDAAGLNFVCPIKPPNGVATGTSNPYSITAYEKVGNVFVIAPPVGTAINPETVYFK